MDFSRLKQTGRVPAHAEADADTRVTGILIVREPGYRPEQVVVRNEIGPTLYTVEFAASDLAALERDPLVQSVTISETLPLQKLP